MTSHARSHGVHGVVGFTRVEGYTAHHSLDSSRSTVEASNTKPWKRHNNAKKREKLRRIAGHLDAQWLLLLVICCIYHWAGSANMTGRWSRICKQFYAGVVKSDVCIRLCWLIWRGSVPVPRDQGFFPPLAVYRANRWCVIWRARALRAYNASLGT